MKTYIGKLAVRIGEYQNKVTLLVEARDDDHALEILDNAAANYYGDGSEPKDGSGYYANGGEVHVGAAQIAPISRATFDELEPNFWVVKDSAAEGVALNDRAAERQRA